MPIVEDDAYGMLPAATPPALADFVPDLSYYISGLSKWLGGGLTRGDCERALKAVADAVAPYRADSEP